MLTSLESFGLKRTLYVTFAIAHVVVVSATAFAIDRSVHDSFDRAAEQRVAGDARLLAEALSAPLAQGRDDRVQKAVEGFQEEDLSFVVVQRPDRSVIAKRGTGQQPEELSSLLADTARRDDVTFQQLGDRYAFAMPVRAVADAAGDLKVVTAGAPGSKLLGYVYLGINPVESEQRVSHTRYVVLGFLGLGGLLMGLLMYLLTNRVVLRRIEEMSAVARRVSDCDLTSRAGKGADDEIGILAESLNRIGENLTVTMSRVKGVTDGVGLVIEKIAKTGSTVADGSETVTARVAETGSSMSQMIASLKGIADNVEVLAQSAEESSSSILQMAATNDEVAENIQSLAASVEETTAAIEEMTYSIKEVAKNVEDLSATAEETSSSMNEMDVSISQVESNANETARLSEQVQKDAEMGAEALSRTLGGIDKIKESSKEAAAVIEALGQKIATVGNILNVIDDVAEQTNLLALNAAILAAQSGEHGKGFAVVADEIKDLAERTGASTKEISELIRSVQDQSKNAVSAMDRGVKNVDEGVKLGQETQTALNQIRVSTGKASGMVKAIARATIEQARGSKQVTMAINRIAETVQQIATATAEQARGSEQIMKSAEKMKIITKHVERSSQEQARGSKQITRSIESISEMVNHLNRAQKEQTQGSEQVMVAVEEIKHVAEAQTSSVAELEQAIQDLAGQAQVLRGEVQRFKL
ncbi:MAG TPA: HAMP domain-containing methyl-accepting chemotaxis protein [Anaeromyxobacteraceae bacterium]|jgi:methyl-accepting chemotaxis protein|nr:HAMP domain-containing methyl-accepting chemotaxis protein [Anaeromyxobacteraceae bacterium]